MLTRLFHFMYSSFRLTLAVMAGLFLLAGCGSDDKEKDDKKDDKKPAYERVIILKHRFEQLETSLDEMERDLKIQKKRIESTRETAKAIKRSLLKGNLKGYSLGTITTDPLMMKAIEKKQQKEDQERQEEAEKESSSDTLFNGFLIACFVIFLIAVFVVALKDRNQASPYDAGLRPNYPGPETPPDSVDETSPTEPAGTDDYSEYGELRPPENKTEPESPGSVEPDNPDDEEPRQ